MFNSPFITNDGMASCELWIGYDLWVVMALFSPIEKEQSGLFCYKIHDTEYFMLWSDIIYIMFVWMRLWDPLCFCIGAFNPIQPLFSKDCYKLIIETLATTPFIFQGINLCCVFDNWPTLLSFRCSLNVPEFIVKLIWTSLSQKAAERGGYGGERYEQLEFQKRVAQSYKMLCDSTWKVMSLEQLFLFFFWLSFCPLFRW